MEPEDQKMLDEIFARYHTDSFLEWPAKQQIALDIGYLCGLALKLDLRNGK